MGFKLTNVIKKKKLVDTNATFAWKDFKESDKWFITGSLKFTKVAILYTNEKKLQVF